MTEDQQHKKEAAVAYDYDGDPRWADYWSNVLVPSHLAARPEVLRHFKLKFYQRYVDPDLVVDPLSAISSPRSSSNSEPRVQRRSATGADRSSTTPPPETTRQQSPPASTASRSSFRMDPPTIQFLANAWVTVMAVLAMFPFLPYALAEKAYRLTLLGSAATNLYCIANQHGAPATWNLQGLQDWLRSIFETTGNDFLYLLYAFFFVSASIPLKVAVISLAIRSLEQVVYHLRRNFSNTRLYRKYLDKPSNWVASNSNLLKSLSANAEIGLGFLLIILLLTPQRNIIQAFVHWRLLKMMYALPSTAPYHRSSWSAIGRRVNPLIHQYAPSLATPMAYLQRWFVS
ncbi:uncharacterized protein LOC9659835 [Selaginella moellendorffii]|uniref:uncharacterized protein LOC9659835 n=1 Tax=Selaginella moellendorffii TaxID=88036 RepID=UPI000D1C3386|nr:uncharacterized protein LOC9659835 [Selaginella moellendorffii]|eukprot:XP_024539771.1 uncharacterized protein LOC9659835 [Selaginella moellendorffii]